jgi:hypothetical protein
MEIFRIVCFFYPNSVWASYSWKLSALDDLKLLGACSHVVIFLYIIHIVCFISYRLFVELCCLWYIDLILIFSSNVVPKSNLRYNMYENPVQALFHNFEQVANFVQHHVSNFIGNPIHQDPLVEAPSKPPSKFHLQTLHLLYNLLILFSRYPLSMACNLNFSILLWRILC